MTLPPSDGLDRAAIRVLAVRAHTDRRRTLHALDVAAILDDALAATCELVDDPNLARDLHLAAVGHDLYAETVVEPTSVRPRFGDRVDLLIEGMTDRTGDHDRGAFVLRLRQHADEIRLIKLCDLVDNIASCTYTLHDLGHGWARDRFLPLAEEMRDLVVAAPFARLPATAALLTTWTDLALQRLRSSVALARLVDTAAPTPAPLSEHRWRERHLLAGVLLFSPRFRQ